MEPRTSTPIAVAEPFFMVGQQFAIDLRGARAVFTTRRGGYSRGPYESLNLGRLTADDPDAVARNRSALEDAFEVELGFVRQVHGSRVCELTAASATAGCSAGPDEMARADGQFTVHEGLAPVALTADCLPIAIGGDAGVAMLHGGWRGLHGGVIGAGVRALRAAGCRGPLVAAIGPGAGPCCYEVGQEVHDAFAEFPDHVHRGPNLHLAGIARHQLERAGVEEIHDLALCTICSDPSLLFSHRRDRGITGRQAGIAWLTSDGRG
jgi:YfiH family protein